MCLSQRNLSFRKIRENCLCVVKQATESEHSTDTKSGTNILTRYGAVLVLSCKTFSGCY